MRSMAAGVTCSTRSRAGADLGGDIDPDTGAGTFVVDLNLAHNRPAPDPAWACPLAPPGNRVPAEIRAGELTVPLTVPRLR